MKGVFDRETGNLLYYTDGRVDWKKFLIKDLGNINPVTHAYVGTYEDGEILDTSSDEYNLKLTESTINKPTEIFEEVLDDATSNRIFNTHNYPIHKQLNIIMDEMVKHLTLDEMSDNFKQMYKKISAERNQSQRRKEEMVKDTRSFNFIPKKDKNKIFDERLEKLVNKINGE